MRLILLAPAHADLPEFLARWRVEVVASLPSPNLRHTDAQRGEGVFERSIEALRRLNAAGYAIDPNLVLDLVTNPVGAFLPGNQAALEADWKRELRRRFGVEFNRLYTITNMPISRYLEYLIDSGNLQDYMERLVNAYNPTAAAGVMCRNTLSVGWDGTLYDCDFNQMLELPMAAGAPRSILGAAAAVALGITFFGLQVAPLPAQSSGPSLPYSRGFLVTGDYVVSGVDLREELHVIDAEGFSTAPISISGVPANADIVAAYLFWETVTTGGNAGKTEAAGVKFRGFDIDITNPLSVARAPIDSSGAACFGSGSLVMNMFRADILRFLPVKVDADGKPTGKRIVNAADLTAQDLPAHTVTLPVRGGNDVPESAGGTMVVVYRDPNPNAPLKKIVIYDGNIRKPDTSGSVVVPLTRGNAAADRRITVVWLRPRMTERRCAAFAHRTSWTSEARK